MKISKQEFSVLSAYHDDYLSEEYRRIPSMASDISMPAVKFREAVASLRDKGLLAGTRKVYITKQGVDAYGAIRSTVEGVARDEAPEDESSAPAETPSEASGNAIAKRAPTEPVAVTSYQRKTLTTVLADRLRVSPDQLWQVVSKHVISVGYQQPAPSNEEVLHVMSVMDKYDLDPFMKHVHAFRHKGKLHVQVGYDGWVAISRRSPLFRGVEYEFPNEAEMIDVPGTTKKCWPWVKAVCHVEGSVPTVVYAFFDEWFVPGSTNHKGTYIASNWEMFPTHRLRTKAYCLAVREGLGIALYDEADGEQFHRAEFTDVTEPQRAVENRSSELLAQLESGEEDELSVSDG